MMRMKWWRDKKFFFDDDSWNWGKTWNNTFFCIMNYFACMCECWAIHTYPRIKFVDKEENSKMCEEDAKTLWLGACGQYLLFSIFLGGEKLTMTASWRHRLLWHCLLELPKTLPVWQQTRCPYDSHPAARMTATPLPVWQQNRSWCRDESYRRLLQQQQMNYLTPLQLWTQEILGRHSKL